MYVFRGSKKARFEPWYSPKAHKRKSADSFANEVISIDSYLDCDVLEAKQIEMIIC